MKFTIKYESQDTFARCGELKLNGYSIETPVFWLGKNISTPPDLHNFEFTDAMLVSAYDIITADEIDMDDYNKIHNYFNFNNPILMDSGGYQFQKKDEINISTDRILEIYENLKPDMGVVLDHPLDPSKSLETNRKRWKVSFNNIKGMIFGDLKTPIMPVVHGYTPEAIKKACEELKSIIEDPPLVGLGSLVPLMQNKYTKKVRDNNDGDSPRNLVIDCVRTVRKEFPNSFYHVFGVGGASTMHMLFALGVDSIDSKAWRLKAGFGAIQLPGVSDRFISPPNEKRASLNKKEEKQLSNCSCPICENKSLKERKKELDNSSSTTFQNRAIHNAFVFKEEEEIIKNKIREDNDKKFVMDRLYRSPYKKLLKYGLEQN